MRKFLGIALIALGLTGLWFQMHGQFAGLSVFPAVAAFTGLALVFTYRHRDKVAMVGGHAPVASERYDHISDDEDADDDESDDDEADYEVIDRGNGVYEVVDTRDIPWSKTLAQFAGGHQDLRITAVTVISPQWGDDYLLVVAEKK